MNSKQIVSWEKGGQANTSRQLTYVSNIMILK